MPMAVMVHDPIRAALKAHSAWLENPDNGNRANLSGWTLNEANLASVKLRKAILSRATFLDANLAQADLSGSTMDEADLQRANLAGADLSNTRITETNF